MNVVGEEPENGIVVVEYGVSTIRYASPEDGVEVTVEVT